MKILALFLLSFSVQTGFTQTDSNSAYKRLKTKKLYRVSLSSEYDGSKKVYKANGKVVKKRTYKKYSKNSLGNITTCTPCILKTYNADKILLNEGIYYTDCKVGWHKTYYPNGNVKVSRFYKEMTAENLENLFGGNFCRIETGQWTYFNEDGDTLYSEFWDNGTFKKQVPEQDSVEIWDLEFYLENEKIDTQTISLNDINNIEFRPYFKNSKRDTNFTIKFWISKVGYRGAEGQFNQTTFTTENMKQLFEETGIPVGEKYRIILYVYFGENYIGGIDLNLME